MALTVATYALGFGAGALSTLSPCVLPLLPIVAGAAATAHPRGPLALAGGLALSFAVIGTLVASFGFALGLDGDVFRWAGAGAMLLFGAVLLSGRLQHRFEGAMSGVQTKAGGVLARVTGDGLGGQFLVGLLLGAVWSPCAGPTLGSAALLASRQQDLPQVALTMLMFGLGAAAPLLVLGRLSREVMKRVKGRVSGAGRMGRMALGGALVIVSLLVLTNADRLVETAFVLHGPSWLVDASGAI